MNQLGSRIKLLRQKSNLTQNQLAELVGVDQGSISRWETGNIKPTGRYRRKLEDVLTESLSYGNPIKVFLFTSVTLDIHSSLLLDSELDILSFSEQILTISKLSPSKLLGVNYLSLFIKDWQPIYCWLSSKGAFDKDVQWIKTKHPSFNNSEWIESLWVPIRLDDGKLVFRVSIRHLDEVPSDGLVNIHLQLTKNSYEIALLI